MGDQTEIEKLKYSELLLNEVNMIVASCDINGNITYISPATEKIIGFKTDNLLKEEWWTLTYSSKEEGELFRGKVRNILTGKIDVDPTPYDRKLKCADGGVKWIEWRDTVGINNNLVSVGVDITSWKKKEELKIQSDSILESAISMILVSDIKGNVIYASPSVEKMIGYCEEDILGDNWWKTTYENEYDAHKVRESIYNFIFLNQKDFTDITKQKIRTSRGDYKWIEWQINKGIKDTYISIGTDITNSVLTEIELKKAKEVAEESLKVKNEFLANMSHEIRTPLNAVIGFTDLLLETELTEEQREYLRTMRNSGEILLSLINNVLDLSKLDSEKFEIEEISFDLHQYVKDVVKLMKIKAVEKNIALNLNISSLVPKHVLGDSTRLGQILLNLIGNAVKFTNEGSVTVEVKLKNEKTDIIIIEIIDTGIGIVSNKINTVFGAFSQAKGDTSRIYGGTGLGLTIVKKLIKLLHGEILVESKFGVGSTFKIILPLKRDTSKITVEEVNSSVPVYQNLDLDILLVEDNKTNQFLAKSRLERWNCKVDIANNGIEGVKKTQKKLYDIILMDIQMPVMDGYEATKIIKNDISKQVSEIPIIAMSAYTAKKDIKRALDTGMDDYVFKPFNPMDLYRLLEKYGKVKHHQSIEEAETPTIEIENLKDVKLLDLKFLKGETFNESSLLSLLIKSFNKEIDEYLEAIKIEFENKNWDKLYNATIKITPSITMFGISKLRPIIHTLGTRFKNEYKFNDIETLINSSREIFEHVKIELQTELDNLE